MKIWKISKSKYIKKSRKIRIKISLILPLCLRMYIHQFQSTLPVHPQSDSKLETWVLGTYVLTFYDNCSEEEFSEIFIRIWRKLYIYTFTFPYFWNFHPYVFIHFIYFTCLLAFLVIVSLFILTLSSLCCFLYLLKSSDVSLLYSHLLLEMRTALRKKEVEV